MKGTILVDFETLHFLKLTLSTVIIGLRVVVFLIAPIAALRLRRRLLLLTVRLTRVGAVRGSPIGAAGAVSVLAVEVVLRCRHACDSISVRAVYIQVICFWLTL